MVWVVLFSTEWQGGILTETQRERTSHITICEKMVQAENRASAKCRSRKELGCLRVKEKAIWLE